MALLDDVRLAVGSRIAEGFFNGTARFAGLHPKARPARHGVEVLRDIPYVGDGKKEHLLDVYRPAGDRGAGASRDPEGLRPVVLYVHGGGFRILSKESHWLMGLAYAKRGYVVFNINYRLAPRYPFPMGLEDCAAAFSWVKANAARHGGDASRMVLAGESAGANLVTALTMALTYERPEPFARRAFDEGLVPRAVIPACGVFQVSDIARIRRRKPRMPGFVADRLHEVERAYIGAHAASPGISLDLADPLTVFERGDRPARNIPPFFLPVGTKDPLLDDTRRLARALEGLGVPVTARYYEGEVHAFHAFYFREKARACWVDTFQFLDEHCPRQDGDVARGSHEA